MADLDLHAVPVFPLPGLVALPGTEVGFHFFEPRYRAMARAVLDGTRQLVIAGLAPDEDPRAEAPALEPIAGLARVVAEETNADGTIDVLFAVSERVRLEELPREGLPYRRARCEVIEDVVRPGPALEVTETSLLACARELAAIERDMGGSGGIAMLGTAGVVANRLADRYFRRDPELRRRVLETVDVLARAELVLEHVAQLLVVIRRAQGGMLS
jgi:Lon protease-like protein